MRLASALSVLILLAGLVAASCSTPPGGREPTTANRPFVVRVVDEATGRGVPLMTVELAGAVRYVTDSAGVAALNEPSLAGSDVFAKISGPGYEFLAETPIGRGVVLRLTPGAAQEVRVQRTIVAERLYRLTGEGIYRDSVLAGLPVPLRQPLLNAKVVGQDTVSATPYAGGIFWIWGDTTDPIFANFSVSAAVSDLPENGGLEPSVGVDYRYFTDAQGRDRAMLPLPRAGLVWIEGLFTVADPQGRVRLLATYTRQPGLANPDERGIALFDDAKKIFEPWIALPWREAHRASHPFRVTEAGREYWYLHDDLRVPNDWAAVADPARWERREAIRPPGFTRVSSVAWNAWRRCYLGLLERGGDVFYAEAAHPEGPWSEPVVIARHAHYTFYNVTQHPFFDREGGRVIYFEGTYTAAFSDAPAPTPRYDYNQLMYRLDLGDPRLAAAHRR